MDDVLGRNIQQISSVNQLRLFREGLRDDLKKFNDLKKMTEKLQENQVFAQVIQRTEKVYQNELQVKRAKEFLELFRLQEIEDCEGNDFECLEKVKDMEKKNFLVDSVRTQFRLKLENIKKRLKTKVSDSLSALLLELKWPFISKGQIIALNADTEDKLLKSIRALSELSSVEDLCEILLNPLKNAIISNFLTDTETNSIEKPEWMLNFTKSLISLNIVHLFNKASIPQHQTDRVLALIIPELNNVLFRRLESDIRRLVESPQKTDTELTFASKIINPLKKIIENKKKQSLEFDSLFLHIIDSILNFDKFLDELLAKDFLISRFSDQKFIGMWVGYEKVYITSEIEKILSKESWKLEKITGQKYKNLEEIYLLHRSLNIKYSIIRNEMIREKLVNTLNELISSIYVQDAEQIISLISGNFYYYESNPCFWKELALQTAAVHQTLVLFQRFLLKINSNLFAETHFKINQFKEIASSKMLELFSVSVDELVFDYLANVSSKHLNINQKMLSNLSKDLKDVASKELAKNVFGFCLQKGFNKWMEKIKQINLKRKKKEEVEEIKESLLRNFSKLFEVLNDCGEFSEGFVKIVNEI
jgi:hypothetical protein